MNPKISVKHAAQAFGVTTQALHQKLKKLEIKPKISNKKAFLTHKESRKLFYGANSLLRKTEGITITIQIVKGGTGKTTILGSLATRMCLYGAKVLCIDLDQQANLTSLFGVDINRECPVMIDIIESKFKKNGDKINLLSGVIEVFPGLHLLPSRIDNAVLDTIIVTNRITNLKKLYSAEIKPLKKQYDYILIDCPPNLSNSVGAATLASDFVISPVSPEGSALEGLDLTMQEFKRLENDYDTRINVKILNNKFDVRTTLSHTVYATLLEKKEYKNNLFKSHIRASQEFPNAYYRGITIFDFLKETPAKEDIDLLTQEIMGIERLQKPPIKQKRKL
jgi:chromosome partitioning protein